MSKRVKNALNNVLGMLLCTAWFAAFLIFSIEDQHVRSFEKTVGIIIFTPCVAVFVGGTISAFIRMLFVLYPKE